jgi:transcriptional regulator with XRE-family HTH domain
MTETPRFDSFAAKLNFVLKALSVSRGALAAGLGVNKSVVTRWASGAAQPSVHNLTRLSAFVAERAPGFTVLDWERSLESLAELMGASPQTTFGAAAGIVGSLIPLPLLEEVRVRTRQRGAAYEGIYRSTRPLGRTPGVFVHDHILLRRDANGLMSVDVLAGGVQARGWALLLQNQVFAITAELTSGSFAFAILNGVAAVRAERIDGIFLRCATDSGRTPLASLVVYERVAEVTADAEQDMATLRSLDGPRPIAATADLDPDVVAAVVRDFGPSHVDINDDWIMCLPLSRSLSNRN